VLGAQGVALHRKVEDIAAKIESHNKELRARSAAIPPNGAARLHDRRFLCARRCSRCRREDRETERKLAAIREQDPIRRAEVFNTLSLPTFDLVALANILQQDVPALDEAAAARVQQHTLSAGDRNTLALAFFFSTLDNDPNLATKTVIIDDPVSSLDEHRSLATVHEIRRLAQRVAQVIVLSHDKKFLARIWDDTNARRIATAIQIERAGQGSTLAAWNVSADATTEYDRRHALLREYLANNGNARTVAAAIRPVLEGYVRVAQARAFSARQPPRAIPRHLRPTRRHRERDPRCVPHTRAATDPGVREPLPPRHQPAWETETINDTELEGFVKRTLGYVRR
jgi:hypothetical protein